LIRPETVDEGPGDELQARQVALLYSNAPLALLGGLVVVAITGYLLHQHVDQTSLLIWLGAVGGLYLLRLVAVLLFRQATSLSQAGPLWRQLHLAGASLTGLAWGIGGALLLPTESIPLQAFMLLVLAGVGAGATAFYAAVRGPAIVLISTALLPTVGYFAWLQDEIHLGMALLGGLFWALMLGLDYYMHAAIRRSISLGLENDQLARASREAKEQSERLNQQLETTLTEHRRTEETLRASEARLVNAQRIAGIGHWEWSIAKNEITWSDQTYRLFGVEPEAFDVTYQRYLERVHPADRSRVEAATKAALGQQMPFSVDYRILWPDGTVRVVHDEGEVMRDRRGRAVRMAGVIQDVSRRTEAEARIRRSERELARILDNMQDTYFRCAADGRLVRASPSAHRLLGFPLSDLIGLAFHALFADPTEYRRLEVALEKGEGSVSNFEVRIRRRDQAIIWVSMNVQQLTDRSSQSLGMEGTVRDITDFRQATEALARSQQRALVTLESIGDGVITTDAAGRITYLNPVAERLIGIDSEVAEGRFYREVFTFTDETTDEPLGDLVAACIADGNGITQVEQGVLRRAEGGESTLNLTVAPLRDSEGRISGAVLVMHDISALLSMAKQLSHQASHDMLTGLSNRYGFEAQLEKLLADEEDRRPHALFFLDLDQLKVVNDSCGHRAGDELLKQITDRLRQQLRRQDSLARIGGDEFAVLLEGSVLADAEETAERLQETVRDFRFQWQDKSFDNSVSIGVVPFESGNGITVADLMSAADSTCFLAKEGGRNRIQIYRPEDGALQRHQNEMEWVQRINQALEEERFLLYLQPIVPCDPDDGSLPHFEVLMRMLSMEGKVVPPGAYIPAAERYHLMSTLDRWVVRTTLEKLAELQGNGERAPIVCGVNLSGQSLTDPEFLDFIIRTFAETGTAYESVVFEITETAAIGNMDHARALIAELRRRGCGFALDDFGSGLSSFGYLKNLPVDFLKIDGAFVRDMVNDRIDRAMVAAIHQVGAVMGIQTIAEYVDSRAAVEALRQIGVDFAQGYWLGQPAPWQEALKRVGPSARARVREVASGMAPASVA